MALRHALRSIQRAKCFQFSRYFRWSEKPSFLHQNSGGDHGPGLQRPLSKGDDHFRMLAPLQLLTCEKQWRSRLKLAQMQKRSDAKLPLLLLSTIPLLRANGEIHRLFGGRERLRDTSARSDKGLDPLL